MALHQRAPLLFLSHAGVDSEAVRQLKRRIEAAPEAQRAGLKVWFDKDNLKAGQTWRAQLEAAIAEASAFAVYVGSGGVANWVEAEVDLALQRATRDGRFPFIPILANDAMDVAALPGFASRFQAVRNVEHSPDEFQKLVAAVLGLGEAGRAMLEAEPFFGLKAIDETRNHLFFGRERETAELVARLATDRLLMVTGDSGSGKSSLVRAGLVPRWRGGALAGETDELPGEDIWHVVETRPRGNPRRALGDAVFETSRQLGASIDEAGKLREWAVRGDVSEVALALSCSLPATRTRTLLVVDQFEELCTLTSVEQRQPYVDLLLALADPANTNISVVVTMRRDYYNLLEEFAVLYQRLEADDRRARMLLGRMHDEDLRRVVTEPLKLAGVQEADRESLADSVLKDVGERPGDLALVQFALTETWRHRAGYAGDLPRAYAGVGRVEGALARAAERVFEQVLRPSYSEAEIEAVFVRLVRLGDTGGATRRLARRREFDDRRWEMLQTLAGERGNRLILFTGAERDERAEIAHESLVTQWPRFQRWLQAGAADKRALDALIERASAWANEPNENAKTDRLATGVDRESFVGLHGRRGAWLSAIEEAFVGASQNRFATEQAEKEKRRRRERFALIATVALLLISIGTSVFAFMQFNEASKQVEIAETATTSAVQSAALVQTEVAPAIANEGLVDRALLMLLDAAPSLPSPAPPSVEIAFHRVLQQAAGLEEYPIPANVDVFHGPNELYLESRDTGDVYLLASELPPPRILIGEGNGQLAAIHRVDEATFVLVYDDGSVFSANSVSRARTLLFSFPSLSTSADDPAITVLIYGTFILRQRYEDGITSAQIYDVAGNGFIALSIHAFDLVIQKLSDGTPYLTSSYVNGGWAIDFGQTPPTAELPQLADDVRDELRYRRCVEALGSGADDHRQTIIDAYGNDDDGVYSVAGCRANPAGILLQRQTGSSSGPIRSDLLIGADLEDDDVRAELETLLAVDGEGLPQGNLSWLAASARAPHFAAAMGRNVYTFSLAGGRYPRWLTLAEAPSAGIFIADNRLAVVQSTRARIAVIDIGRNQWDPRPSIESPDAARYMEVGVVDGDPQAPLDGRVSISTCANMVASVSSNFVAADGRPVRVSGGGNESSDPSPAVLTVDGVDLKIADDAICVDVSRDLTLVAVHFDHLVGISNVALYQVADIQEQGGVDGLKPTNLGVGQVNSAHFIGDSHDLVYTNGGNVVWRATKTEQSPARWSATVIHRSGGRIIGAELDPRRNMLLVIEDLTRDFLRSFLYSLEADREWGDLSHSFRWQLATFVGDYDIAATGDVNWDRVVRLPPIASLLDEARKELSPACLTGPGRNPRESPCWNDKAR